MRAVQKAVVLVAFLSVILITSCGLPPSLIQSTATPISTTPEPSLPAATETALPTAPASWKTFSDPDLHIQFRYPAQWQAETPLHLSGADGFVEVSLLDYPASLFDVMRSVCVLEANTDNPGNYGTYPLIANWQGWDTEQQTWAGNGCAVMPSDEPPSTGSLQAILFARFPQPLMHDQLLVLRADNTHFETIISTLRFQDYAIPTPSGGIYDSPACQMAEVGLPQVALRTDTLAITETAITSAACDPWLHFDGFQALAGEVRRGQTRRLTIQDGGFNAAWVGDAVFSYEYASAPLFPVGSPSQVNITRNGQVVDTLAVAQAGPAGYPVYRFWSWDGHWLLEMDSVVVQDGKVLNSTLKYSEIFEWGLVNGEPFYFFQKDADYGISYAGKELPLRYDDVIHGKLCCDPSVYSIISTPSGALFYALRDDVWYLVQALVR